MTKALIVAGILAIAGELDGQVIGLSRERDRLEREVVSSVGLHQEIAGLNGITEQLKALAAEAGVEPATEPPKVSGPMVGTIGSDVEVPAEVNPDGSGQITQVGMNADAATVEGFAPGEPSSLSTVPLPTLTTTEQQAPAETGVSEPDSSSKKKK